MVGEDIRNGKRGAHFFRGLTHDVDLFIRIGVELVESHHWLLAKRPDALDMLTQVAQSTLHRGWIRSIEIRLEDSAVPF